MCQLLLWEWNVLILTPGWERRQPVNISPAIHSNMYKVGVFDDNLDSFVDSPEYSLFKTWILNSQTLSSGSEAWVLYGVNSFLLKWLENISQTVLSWSSAKALLHPDPEVRDLVRRGKCCWAGLLLDFGVSRVIKGLVTFIHSIYFLITV